MIGCRHHELRGVCAPLQLSLLRFTRWFTVIKIGQGCVAFLVARILANGDPSSTPRVCELEDRMDVLVTCTEICGDT
jgi:hypothetical protein